jgi:hypothetical protein
MNRHKSARVKRDGNGALALRFYGDYFKPHFPIATPIALSRDRKEAGTSVPPKPAKLK